jgi:DNA-binding transcriptional regulator YhcF (GntR family)
MPRADRPAPPYVQIAGYYRDEIASGQRRAGERLPSIAAIAEGWAVAAATAAKAIGLLCDEGLISTSPQGSFVLPHGTEGKIDAAITAADAALSAIRLLADPREKAEAAGRLVSGLRARSDEADRIRHAGRDDETGENPA